MKFALIQVENTFDVCKNIEAIKSFMRKEDVTYYMTGESSITGYSSDEDTIGIALDDERLLDLLDFCKRHNKHLFVGCNIIDDKQYIAYLYIHKKIEVYYKSHLGIKEKKKYEEGSSLGLFDTGEFKVGVAICIESHIPDISQTLRMRGADIILMPFASPGVCGSRESMWKKYLPARAYDNGVYVLASNQTGGMFTGGLAGLDYKGEMILSHYKQEACIRTVDLDIEARRSRLKKKKANYIDRRRSHLYGKEDQWNT